jgi:hypothetical protein
VARQFLTNRVRAVGRGGGARREARYFTKRKKKDAWTGFSNVGPHAACVRAGIRARTLTNGFYRPAHWLRNNFERGIAAVKRFKSQLKGKVGARDLEGRRRASEPCDKVWPHRRG